MWVGDEGWHRPSCMTCIELHASIYIYIYAGLGLGMARNKQGKG